MTQQLFNPNSHHPHLKCRAAPTFVCGNLQCRVAIIPANRPQNVGAPVRGARTPRQRKRLRINRNHHSVNPRPPRETPDRATEWRHCV